MTIIGNPIYDIAEEASFFAEFFAIFIGNGIYPNPSTGMQVLANNGMNLQIQPGKCFINGYFGLVEEGGEIVSIEPADTNYNRIDRIVARWDLEIRKIIPFVLKGEPASKPVAPSLTRNSNIYEIALADVAVKANTTAITQANITDRRLDTSLCGIVSGVINQVDTTTLFNQYQAWFEERKQESAQDYQEWFDGFTEPSEQQFTEWFEGIKGRLGEDVATNLQVQIDQVKEEGVIVSPTEPENDRRKVWFQKGKNLLDLKYAKELTSIDVSTGIEIYSDTNFCGENYISAIPNTVYTISSNKPLINIRLSEYTNEKEHIQRNQEANSNSLTIITSETTKYLRWSLNIDNSSTVTVDRLRDLGLQLEQNSERTDYETYINNTIHTKNDNNIYEDFLRQVSEDIKRKTLEMENPVGHIRMETTNVNPANYLGFGTWTLWGSGRVPVGVNTTDTDFATVEKTGGSKTVKLTVAQIPSHTHTFTGKTHSHGLNSHTHTYSKSATVTGSHTLTKDEIPKHYHYAVKASMATTTLSGNNCLGTYATSANSDLPYSLRGVANATDPTTGRTSLAGSGTGHTHSITLTSTNSGQASGNTANATATGTNGNTGGNETHNNIQPYITCYMWKRTA